MSVRLELEDRVVRTALAWRRKFPSCNGELVSDETRALRAAADALIAHDEPTTRYVAKPGICGREYWYVHDQTYRLGDRTFANVGPFTEAQAVATAAVLNALVGRG